MVHETVFPKVFSFSFSPLTLTVPRSPLRNSLLRPQPATTGRLAGVAPAQSQVPSRLNPVPAGATAATLRAGAGKTIFTAWMLLSTILENSEADIAAGKAVVNRAAGTARAAVLAPALDNRERDPRIAAAPQLATGPRRSDRLLRLFPCLPRTLSTLAHPSFSTEARAMTLSRRGRVARPDPRRPAVPQVVGARE